MNRRGQLFVHGRDVHGIRDAPFRNSEHFRKGVRGYGVVFSFVEDISEQDREDRVLRALLASGDKLTVM